MSVDLGNAIKGIMGGVISSQNICDLEVAKVIDPEGPLIQIESTMGTLPAAAISVPDYMSSYTVTVSGAASGELTIDNSLKKDDRVYLLRKTGGQKYLVLGRVV